MIKKHRQSTGSTEGSRLTKMHEEQWMHHRCEVQRYPRAEAKEMWERVKGAVVPHQTDEGGPAHSKYRQPMPSEDYIDFWNTLAQEQELVTLGKKQQVKSKEELDALQASISGSMARHTDAAVFGARAGVASALAVAVDGASGDNTLLAGVVRAAAGPAAKKAKVVDTEVLANKLVEKASAAAGNIKNKVKLASEAKQQALDATKDEHGACRISVANVVPGLGNSVGTMENRFTRNGQLSHPCSLIGFTFGPSSK